MYAFTYPFVPVTSFMTPVIKLVSCRYLATFAREWRGICAIGATLAFNISLNNTSMLNMTLSLNQVIRWACANEARAMYLNVKSSIQSRYCFKSSIVMLMVYQ